MAWSVKAGGAIQFTKSVNQDVARRMFDCMLLAQQQLMDDLGTPYPPASVPGQYPRKRTGNLQRSVIIWPATVRGVLNTRPRRIALWYDPRAWYGYLLIQRGRRGPDDTLRKMRSQFDRIFRAKRRE